LDDRRWTMDDGQSLYRPSSIVHRLRNDAKLNTPDSLSVHADAVIFRTFTSSKRGETLRFQAFGSFTPALHVAGMGVAIVCVRPGGLVGRLEKLLNQMEGL